MQLWRDGTHATLDLAELFEVAGSTGYRTIQRAGLLTDSPPEAAGSAT